MILSHETDRPFQCQTFVAMHWLQDVALSSVVVPPWFLCGGIGRVVLVLQFGKYTQVSILHRCQKSLTAFVFLQLFDPTTRTLAQGMVNRNLDEGKLVHQNIFLYQNWNQHSYIIHKSSFFLYQMGWVKKENGQLKWICMLSNLHSETCIFTIDPFWIIHKYMYIYI